MTEGVAQISGVFLGGRMSNCLLDICDYNNWSNTGQFM